MKFNSVHLPESWVRIVFNELRGIFYPDFLYQGTTVPQGADFKVDEVVFVWSLWILWSKIPEQSNLMKIKSTISKENYLKKHLLYEAKKRRNSHTMRKNILKFDYIHLHNFIQQDRFDLQVFKVADVSRCLDGFLF